MQASSPLSVEEREKQRQLRERRVDEVDEEKRHKLTSSELNKSTLSSSSLFLFIEASASAVSKREGEEEETRGRDTHSRGSDENDSPKDRVLPHSLSDTKQSGNS